ncbi:phosphatidylinositol-specific phospholipase C domain-containing protein [Nocardia sp. NPDC052254]|uniref:phosphatidylinositol-specific phospholipase C n=1 Tax=Nocardia sp. NPDC052254 TaxID=3155681 RepID=UPI0034343A72
MGGEIRKRAVVVVAVAAVCGVTLTGCGRTVAPSAQPVAATMPATQPTSSGGVPGPEAATMPRAAATAAVTDHLDAANNPDWMAALPDSTPLNAMSIPGTHDSVSIHGGKAGPAVVTQEKFDTGCADPACASARTLSTQLDAGIRAVDIRVRRDEAGNLAVQHGSFYQEIGLEDVLRVSEEFLSQHPRETVLMRVKAECTNDDKAFQCADAGRQPPDPALLDRILNAHPRMWRPSATGPAAVPRLGEVRGSVVVIRADGVDDRGLPLDLQDLWDGPSREDKWAAVAAHMDRTAAGGARTLSVDFLSASGVPDPTKFPNRYADYENQHAVDHLRSRPGTTTGVLMMDFPGPALVGEIIGHNPH